MARTSKPLVIVALPPCDEWDELKRLEGQGHTVYRLNDKEVSNRDSYDWGDLPYTLLEADIILGPNCWRMTTLHSKYLPVAIKEARMLRYKVKGKEEMADVKNRKAADDEFGSSGGVQPESRANDVELPTD